MRPVRALLERLGLVRNGDALERYSEADAAVVAALEAVAASRRLRGENGVTADYEAAENQRLTGGKR